MYAVSSSRRAGPAGVPPSAADVVEQAGVRAGELAGGHGTLTGQLLGAPRLRRAIPGKGGQKRPWEVIDVRRCLLVLDMDLLALDEELDLEPISYLVARPDAEPCDVVVLSLVSTRQRKLPRMEMLLGARIGKFPVAPRPDHDVGSDAEHRMNLAVRHLRTIGCQASGVISDEDLLHAVRSETRAHDYDEVILAVGRPDVPKLARALHLDPVHRLRRRWGQRLTVFREPTPETRSGRTERT
jgi:hypothetical protein